MLRSIRVSGFNGLLDTSSAGEPDNFTTLQRERGGGEIEGGEEMGGGERGRKREKAAH